MAEDRGEKGSPELTRRQARISELQARQENADAKKDWIEKWEAETELRPTIPPAGITFVSMPKREYGSVRDAWAQFMWIVNSTKGERVTMDCSFENGYDRAISRLFGHALNLDDLEMVLMLDGDDMPEIGLHQAVAYARESFRAGYGAVCSPVATQALRVMVMPIFEKSKTEPYDVAVAGITNFGFISAAALRSLPSLGKWGDSEENQWDAYIEERIGNGTGDAHLCSRLRQFGWRIRADPRLLCTHDKRARIQSDRPRTQIQFG